MDKPVVNPETANSKPLDSVQHYIKEGVLYKPVIPNIQNWPIANFFRRKDSVLQEVIEEALARLHLQAKRQGINIPELIERTMYLERIRIAEDPWKVDPKDEHKFWEKIKSGLVYNEQLEADVEAFSARNQNMLREIVDRYGREISGTFKPDIYHFAKRFLPFIFSSLLNASAGKSFRSIIDHKLQLQEKVHLMGETEAIRNLSQKGTIVLVPTHFSNVDSILVGWSLDALGLPAFIYGAGLNLYNNKVLAYFMKRLGAYKVDRRKKNDIYRETLNAYSTIAIQNGVHGLFFPGGTRSRYGGIEQKLKLGLLGTVVEAQRRNCLYPPQGRSGKIFIVPLVMSYHFVLEGASLIKQHLKRTGKEHYYLLDDEFSSYRKFLKFIWKSFSAKSEISLAYGKPMDIFGNLVDEEGNSYDSQGRPVDVRDYFVSRGKIEDDPQRDFEYTKLLGEKIVERYLIENRVFSSHIVAYVAFKTLEKRFPEMDLYSLLRLPEEERYLDLADFKQRMDRILAKLRQMADAGKLHMAHHLKNDTTTIIEHGIQNLGIYHSKRPLTFYDEKSLFPENMNLLYFYHNRMEGYDLANYV